MPHHRPSHPGLWSPRHRALTTGLVLTITLVAFESLAVATIMPIVSADLQNDVLYGWVFAAFVLANLLGIVVVGSLIDRGGLVRPFLGGLGVFSIGLVVGGLAPTMEVLVAGRVLQGLGAGAIPPVAYVAIGRALPEELRPRMFATLSTAWVLPGVVGPAISGIVAEQLDWRVVFLGLLPLIVLAGAMTVPAISRSVPAEGPPAEGAASSDLRRRLPAAVLLTIGAGLVIGGLTSGTLVPGVPVAIVGLVIGIPAFRLLTPAGTLRVASGLPAAVLLRGLLTFAFFAADAYVPRALQESRGLGAAVSGIALTAATLTWTAGAWIQARHFHRIGARRSVATGFAMLALGIAGFTAVLSPDVPIEIGIATWAVAGLAMGLSYSPLSLVVLAEAPVAEQGTATAGLQMSDVVGTALGTGIGGAIIVAGLQSGAGLNVGLAGAFAVGIGAAVLGAVLARQLPGPRPAGSPRDRASVGGAVQPAVD